MNDRSNLFPDMTPWEYEALKASIKRYKRLLVPILEDEHGNIIDGHQRDRACRELGLKDYWVESIAGISDDDKRDMAFALNFVRRRLNQEQMRDLIAAELRRTPDLSGNWLAQILGTTDKTVEKVRNELIATSEIPKFEKHRGKDGKSRPVTRVTTHTLNDQERAQEVLRSLGNDAPRRPIELRLLERKAARKETQEREASEPPISLVDDAIRIYRCPFQQIEERARIEPSSANLVLTDIPYDGGFLDQLPELAEFAERILVPGGLFVTYSGQYHLDRVMRILGKRLNYRWMRSSVWKGRGTIGHPRQVTSKWKPILVYSKGSWAKRRRWYDVTRVTDYEKKWHPWQQPLDEVERLVRDFSRPGDLIVDPCGGGFTTAVACRWLRDRRCISCEIDEVAFDEGVKRLALEGASDARQTMREFIHESEEMVLSSEHVVGRWAVVNGRTRRAFRDYLHDLGPVWINRFKALGGDGGKEAIAG